MKKLIGGLFETQEQANQAYETLESSGFASEDISMFIHKPRNKTTRSTEVRIQEIAKNAFVGGLILGAIGGLIGFWIGTGNLSLPYLEPGPASRDPLFVLISVIWGLIAGGLTGIILGVASRLFRSREKAEVMTRQIEKRGVLVMIDVKDDQSETEVRRVLEKHNALEIGNPHEKWDLNVWVSPNENNATLANSR